jgi:hypothetical protein
MRRWSPRSKSRRAVGSAQPTDNTTWRWCGGQRRPQPAERTGRRQPASRGDHWPARARVGARPQATHQPRHRRRLGRRHALPHLLVLPQLQLLQLPLLLLQHLSQRRGVGLLQLQQLAPPLRRARGRPGRSGAAGGQYQPVVGGGCRWGGGGGGGGGAGGGRAREGARRAHRRHPAARPTPQDALEGPGELALLLLGPDVAAAAPLRRGVPLLRPLVLRHPRRQPRLRRGCAASSAPVGAAGAGAAGRRASQLRTTLEARPAVLVARLQQLDRLQQRRLEVRRQLGPRQEPAAAPRQPQGCECGPPSRSARASGARGQGTHRTKGARSRAAARTHSSGTVISASCPSIRTVHTPAATTIWRLRASRHVRASWAAAVSGIRRSVVYDAGGGLVGDGESCAVRCALCAVCAVLCAVCCAVCAVRCALCAVRCALCAVRCVLCVLCSRLAARGQGEPPRPT